MAATQYDDLIPLGRAMPLRVYLRTLWERRQFAITVPLGELRAQHMNTVLGNVWHVLSPALLVGVYFLIFGVLVNANRGVDNLIGFLAVGVFSYQYVQRSILQTAQSISNNEGLIRSLSFPRAILPIATVTRETIAFGGSLALMLAVVLLREPAPGKITWHWLAMLVLIPLMGMFALGVGFILARVTEGLRDVRNLLPYAFRLTFYASGVIFPIERRLAEKAVNGSALAESLLHYLPINPLYTYPTLMRMTLLPSYADEYPTEPQWLLWPAAIGYAVLFLVAGFLFFRAAEQRYGRG